MTEMNEIEDLAKRYAEARDALAGKVGVIELEMGAVKRRHLPHLRKRVQAATDARAALLEAVRDGRALFVKPKSRILHGIKVGWQKMIGKAVVRDDARVVAKIREHFPDQFEQLVKTTETPIKSALQRLPANDLKRLGVTVEDSVDQPLVKPADGEIDKLVEALLKDQQEPEAEAAE